MTRVSVADGYRFWSPTYDTSLNPLLALETRVLCPRLEPLTGRSLVDAATGTGRWMEYATGRGARVCGVDLSPHMLAVAARKSSLESRLLVGDMRTLPLCDGAADIAICSFAMTYLPSPELLLRELARIARRVIVSDFHPAAAQAGWKRSFRSDGRLCEIEQFVHSKDDLDRAARAAGLRRQWRIEARFGQPERPMFEAAGKGGFFPEARRVPAVLATCWTRP